MPNPGRARRLQNNVPVGAQHLGAARHPPAASGATGRAHPPPFRMDVPCYTQAVPDLNGPAAAIGPPSPEAVP